MNPLDIDLVRDFVNEHIVYFHQQKIKSLEKLRLKNLLKRKNPYLFKAKNVLTAQDLVRDLLEAYLSSSEEKAFGDFLEELAIFIAGETVGGHKSASTGIDLEFIHAGVYYVVSIKSGPNWGNSSQHSKQEGDFKKAVQVLKQSNRVLNVQPVLGICYGKTKTTYPRNYMKVVGQNFWYFISENPNLYTDIIEPIGYRAEEHNEAFGVEKARIINRFTQELLAEFCSDHILDWERLVAFNSGNLDLTDDPSSLAE